MYYRVRKDEWVRTSATKTSEAKPSSAEGGALVQEHRLYEAGRCGPRPEHPGDLPGDATHSPEGPFQARNM